MKKILVLFIVAVLSLPIFATAQEAVVEEVVMDALVEFNENIPAGYGLVTVGDFNVALLERDIILVDVREVGEFEASHIAGAINIPLRTVAQNLALIPDKSAEIVVMCKGGARASTAATALWLLGYENVRILRGGYDAWIGEDLPVTTDAVEVQVGEVPDVDAVLLAAIDDVLSNIPQGFNLYSAPDLAAYLLENEPFLIDVRTAPELENNGYIGDAVHIPLQEFMFSLDLIPADRNADIIVYCAGGFRGAMVALMLDLMGYTNVRNLNGGFYSWARSDLPITAAPEPEVTVEEFDLVTAISDYLASAPATFNAIRVAEFAAQLEAGTDALIIDVRTVDEYVEGSIPGAFNIPMTEFFQNLAYLPDLEEEIVVICGSGHRSALVVAGLQLLGYENSVSMLAGFGVWSRDGHPSSTDPVEYEPGVAPALNVELLELIDNYISNIPRGWSIVRATDLSVELFENPPALLLDVRTQGEWDAGYIEDAVHIPLNELVDRMGELPEDKTASIVVYDNPTHRSSFAMFYLNLMGYENVRTLGGGSGAWVNADLPLVQD